jgi:hypothetical protein
MVKLKDDDNTTYGDIEMIAYIAPLNCGVRRGSRYLSGYTPTYSNSNQSVWGLCGEFARVKVCWPFTREINMVNGYGWVFN